MPFTARERMLRRRRRNRWRLRKQGRPRLSVFRSHAHMYAQVIDDSRGCTLAAASTLDPEFRAGEKRSGVDAARAVGEMVARRALEAGVKEVVFDRGGYLYHGRVLALADGARAGGLGF